MEQNQISINEINDRLIKIERFMKKMQGHLDDLDFARSVNEAWKDVGKGNFKEMSSEEFLTEIRSIK